MANNLHRHQFIDTQITVRQDFDDDINKNNRRRQNLSKLSAFLNCIICHQKTEYLLTLN